MDGSWQTALTPSVSYSSRAVSGVSQWLLRRGLSRRSGRVFAIELATALARRIIAAACSFISMLIVAWLGAFARAISAGGWRAFKTLNETSISVASHQAAHYQADLLPVLLTWAVLLIVTPTGDRIAFRTAIIVAATLGYLHFAPPPFAVTPWVSRLSNSLVSADSTQVGVGLIWILCCAVPLLHLAALRVFQGLDDMRFRASLRFHRGASWQRGTRHLCAALLIVVILLLVVWAATVTRLAASDGATARDLASYGSQGGLEQGRYLLVVAAATVVVLRCRNTRRALCVAVLSIAAIMLVPRLLSLSSPLQEPLLTSQLAGLGREWGADSVWSAFFAYVPVVLIAMYLVDRWLGPPAARPL